MQGGGELLQGRCGASNGMAESWPGDTARKARLSVGEYSITYDHTRSLCIPGCVLFQWGTCLRLLCGPRSGNGSC